MQMADPSATYISPTRRKPDVSEKAIDYLKLADDDYRRIGKKYPSANPADKPKLNKMCADIALDYYNNKNDTKFEFVDETFNSYSVSDPWGIWIDCCFNAKDDSSIKHFSAEIQYLHQSGLELSCFKVLEDETEVGCANCTHASPAMEIVEKVKDSKMLKTPAIPSAQLKFNKKCAEMALSYFNYKNHTKFEFVETELLDSHPIDDPWGVSIYCCFNAKDDSSINHFSSIIHYLHQFGPAAISCKILEGETEVCFPQCTHTIPAMSTKEDCKVEIVENVRGRKRRITVMDQELAPDYLHLGDEQLLGLEYPAAKLELHKMCDIALDYYNYKNNTEFEFVEAELPDSYSISYPWGFLIYCCFTAKENSSINNFYALIHHEHQSEPAAVFCKILEGETEVGCCSRTHASPALSKKEDHYVDRKIVENAKDPKRRRTILDQEVAPEFPDFREPKRGLKTLANPAAQFKFDKVCADIALDYYNKKKDTKFEFAEAKLLDSHSFSRLSGITILCCFLAKNDSSINHFCATIDYEHQSGLDVRVCLKLEDASDVPVASLVLPYCNHYSSEEARKALEKVPKRPKREILSFAPDGAVSRGRFAGSLSDGWIPSSPAYKPCGPAYTPSNCV